ncbi:MAG TPA: PAS domain-containing protein, partial [Polyangiaceae bacterium LLY-WYZ-15_(1-7)]|nr:PAS domain-containing protein [Polyangiaceae bacterium LLY-WYZ-15_(1-7)]
MFDAVFDALPDPALVVRAGGEVAAANAALRALLGAPAGALVGRRIDELAEDLPTALLDGSCAQGDVFRLVLRGRR